MATIDGHDITTVEAELTAAEADLKRHTAAVAQSIKIKDFAKGTEEGLLAKYMVPHLKEKMAFNAAKVMAQADPAYIAEREKLMDVFEIAQKHIEDFKVAQKRWETARSLYSMAKEQFKAAYEETRKHPG